MQAGRGMVQAVAKKTIWYRQPGTQHAGRQLVQAAANWCRQRF